MKFLCKFTGISDKEAYDLLFSGKVIKEFERSGYHFEIKSEKIYDKKVDYLIISTNKTFNSAWYLYYTNFCSFKNDTVNICYNHGWD